jgi:putative spermidine/putrescine transport system ATP-binding protein
MIDLVGLEGHAHKRPSGLSAGQQQRVALARALVYAPPVLLLDEPFSALDKNLCGQMQEEVRRLHRETGTTFVFVTHDQSEALALSTRIAIFEAGRLRQLAAPRDVYERPASRFVAEFLGDINILPLERIAPGGDVSVGLFEGQPIRTGAAGEDDAANLAVRPEYMRLHLAPPGSGNAVAARLDQLIYLGAETRLALRTAGGAAITLVMPTAELPQGLEPGAAVWAGWPETRGFLL